MNRSVDWNANHDVAASPVVLVVAMADSIHTARWLDMVRGAGIRFALVKATIEPTIAVRDVHPVQTRADLDALAPEEIGLWTPPEGGENDSGAVADPLPGPLHGPPDRGWLVRGSTIRQAIGALRPDLVHSLEIQCAGYSCLAAARQMGVAFPPWLVSNWGSDIYLYRKLTEHKPVLAELVSRMTACLCECRRDLAIVREMGFRGVEYPVLPATGGSDFAWLPRLDSLPPPSLRRDVVIKGYHGWAGRGLHILSALHLAASRLRSYRFRIVLGNAAMAAMAEVLRERDGLHITMEARTPDHRAVLARIAGARMLLGCGISDGIGTTLLEAMALGAFPVINNTACAGEWVRPGVDGFLVDPHDVAALAEAIVTAAEDDLLVDEAAQRNRVEVERRWNINHNRDIGLQVYRDLLKSPGAAPTVMHRLGDARLSESLWQPPPRRGHPTVVPLMPHPKVSVAIPVYNGARYLAEAVQSVLDQTYDNVEVVIVDDGSTDDGQTAAVARRFERPNVRFIQQQNQGVGGAMNTAIANLSGDIFCWLSHDDLHLPHKLTRQVEFFNRLGRPDAILFSDYFLIDQDGNHITEVKMPHEKLRTHPMLALLNGCINGCTLFIPVPILRKFGPFDASLKYTQDYDLWNRILQEHEFFHQPETLIKYRIHPGQDTQKPSAVIEADKLWVRIMESRSVVECAQLFGSTLGFYEGMAKFLDTTPYGKAGEYARRRCQQLARDTLVSVIIPFYNEIANVVTAADSVLQQTHGAIELILVDDGSTEPVQPVIELMRSDARIAYIRQDNAGAAAARNHGMQVARGEYIAFLDADDRFMPTKIQQQLAQMQAQGSFFSHTSYYVTYPRRYSSFATAHSGSFGGMVYPRIMTNCPIATPTVMLHRMLIDAGHCFPVGLSLGEDVLFWIDIAQRYNLLGLDEPLSIVEWSDSSAAINVAKSIQAHRNLITALWTHPVHSRYRSEIELLGVALQWILEQRRSSPELFMAVIRSVFGSDPELDDASRDQRETLFTERLL